MTSQLSISKEVARRYVLGRQGLWPGRRYQGVDGVAAAIRASESIQVDTISIIARNHDLALWSRVQNYQPADLIQLLYTDRTFFEYGSILFVYPLSEWRYWQPIMQRSTNWRESVRNESQHLIELVRQEINQNGALASRDFKDREKVPGGFQVVKDVGHGLSYLWLTGEILIHSRRGNDRVYDFTNRLLANHFQADQPVSLEEAEYYFACKCLRDTAFATPAELGRRLRNLLHRSISPTLAKGWLQQMVAQKTAIEVRLAEDAEVRYCPIEDIELLQTLQAGKIPPEWQPLATTTEQEVNFMAPLDNLIWDRARVLKLFDFEYVWEVYKPAAQRRWGYYTLPILYGDRLVARLDPRLDRKAKQFHILKFWLDDKELSTDSNFKAALEAGLDRYAEFHKASLVWDCEKPF